MSAPFHQRTGINLLTVGSDISSLDYTVVSGIIFAVEAERSGFPAIFQLASIGQIKSNALLFSRRSRGGCFRNAALAIQSRRLMKLAFMESSVRPPRTDVSCFFAHLSVINGSEGQKHAQLWEGNGHVG